MDRNGNEGDHTDHVCIRDIKYILVLLMEIHVLCFQVCVIIWMHSRLFI